MKWSLELCKVAGIKLVIHWTFWILVVWVLLVAISQDYGLTATLSAVSLLFAVFGCVVLHEFGHAMVAKRFGIRTRSITLLPIGGLARLEKMPEEPSHEVWIALAGPAVNVVIAGVLFCGMWLFAGIDSVFSSFSIDQGEAADGRAWIDSLLWVNVFLAGFNLLPAFPMDGGRVLRAILAHRIEYVRATGFAASVGQFMALLFFLGGLFLHPILLFIALFVFFGAEAEAQAVRVRAAFKGVPVGEIMITRAATLSEEKTVGDAVRSLLEGAQQDFPVVDANGVVSGMLTRSDILKSLAEHGRELPVREAMRTEFPKVKETDPLDAVFPRFQESGLSALPVVDDTRLIGILTMENMMELVMIDRALRDRDVDGRSRQAVEDVLRET